MPRKSGSPPTNRDEEESWKPPGSEEPLQRSLDLALEIEIDTEEKEEPEFIYGDIVRDTEAENPINLVVANIPGLTAEEWEFEDGTLANRDEKYPDDDSVVVVVSLRELEEYMPDWDEREIPIELAKLIEDDISFSAYPSLRLVRIKNSHLRE